MAKHHARLGVEPCAGGMDLPRRLTFARTRRRELEQRRREKLPPLEVLQSTLQEFAKLAALLLCLLSVYLVFHSLFFSIEDPPLFLQPHHTFVDRILGSLFLLGVSAAISFVGGVIFREAAPPPH